MRGSAPFTALAGNIKLTELIEVGFDLLGRGLLTDSSNENLLCFIRFALRLGSGVLGVDLLAVQAVGGNGEDPVHSLGVGEGDETEASASLNRARSASHKIQL